MADPLADLGGEPFPYASHMARTHPAKPRFGRSLGRSVIAGRHWKESISPLDNSAESDYKLIKEFQLLKRVTTRQAWGGAAKLAAERANH
jgi:hypothetical protein